MRRAYATHASPPARPPTPRPARPPAQHVAETRYRDSSRPPVRYRSPGRWGGGGRESRARPSFPVLIRYTRDGMGIRVKKSSIGWLFHLSMFLFYHFYKNCTYLSMYQQEYLRNVSEITPGKLSPIMRWVQYHVVPYDRGRSWINHTLDHSWPIIGGQHIFQACWYVWRNRAHYV
jgi:hypothetical protein